MLSVIVPIYNEEKYIAKCIDSILAQDYPNDNLEILLIDGMSKDRTREIAGEYVAANKNIRILDNPRRTAPCAMNVGIKAAKGDIIIRLDAHALFPSDYFSTLVGKLVELKADNVGGICRTLPAKDNMVSKCIANVLSSSFGMGNSSFRVGAKQVQKVDTVPFGCYHRELFDKIGLYDEELTRNQDDELNGRIVKNGGSIYLLPDVVIEYYARDTIDKVYKMFYQYGLFKPLVNKKLGSPATLRQFFPLLFVIGLLLGWLSMFISKWLFIAYLAVVALYFLLATIFSLRYSKKISYIFTQNYIYFVVHFAYGWGYLNGIYRLMTSKSFVANINR